MFGLPPFLKSLWLILKLNLKKGWHHDNSSLIDDLHLLGTFLVLGRDLRRKEDEESLQSLQKKRKYC